MFEKDSVKMLAMEDFCQLDLRLTQDMCNESLLPEHLKERFIRLMGERIQVF